MSLGETLARLRREQNLTQEQLAELLGVSRQAVSKWENGTALPETEKLLRLGDLLHCSMDELLRGRAAPASAGQAVLPLRPSHFERRSRITVCGLPLWHVNIGSGRAARGIFAVGLKATGVVSVGIFSAGVVSVGVLSLGVFAFGVLAAGLLAGGSLALGLLACGALCAGIVSAGSLSVGSFSVGAMAIGRYFALGDHARAWIALGRSQAVGRIYQALGPFSTYDMQAVRELLELHTPAALTWAKDLILLFLYARQ